MVRASSILLLLIGIAAVGVGVFGGLSALAGLYQGAMEAPLDQPEGTEEAVARNMMTFVLIGAGGLVPLLMGTLFWKRDRARARRQARQER